MDVNFKPLRKDVLLDFNYIVRRLSYENEYSEKNDKKINIVYYFTVFFNFKIK